MPPCQVPPALTSLITVVEKSKGQRRGFGLKFVLFEEVARDKGQGARDKRQSSRKENTDFRSPGLSDFQHKNNKHLKNKNNGFRINRCEFPDDGAG
jgi:hypothetical protein